MQRRIFLLSFLLVLTLFGAPLQAKQKVSAQARQILAATALVRPAPPISWTNPGNANKETQLNSLQGQPILLLVTPSLKNHAFRAQLNKLEYYYEQLAGDKLICLVALSSPSAPEHPSPKKLPSNIPLIEVEKGVQVATDYNIGPKNFGIALIAANGNLCLVNEKPLSGRRIADLINASYPVQSSLRTPSAF